MGLKLETYKSIYKGFSDGKEFFDQFNLIEKLNGEACFSSGTRESIAKIQGAIKDAQKEQFRQLFKSLMLEVKNHEAKFPILKSDEVSGKEMSNYMGIYLKHGRTYELPCLKLEDFDTCITMMNDAKKEIEDIANTFETNDNKYKAIYIKAFENLLKQDFIVHKDQCRYAIKDGSSKTGRIVTYMYGGDEIRFTYDITADVSNWSQREKRVIEEVSTTMLKQTQAGRAVAVKDFLKQICDRHGFRTVDMYTYPEVSEAPYDFGRRDNYVNLNVDLKNPKVRDKFEGDLVNAISTILYLEEAKTISAPLEICVGNEYFFYHKKTYEKDGDTYLIMDCKGNRGKGKPLLKVYKNGVKLGIRARRRILNEALYQK